MEPTDIKPEIQIMSQSAFHRYMTSKADATDMPKSSFNPYRKKAGIFSFLSFDAIEKALMEPAKEDKKKSNQSLIQSPVMSTLETIR